METDDRPFLRRILDDFVLVDCRLADHPTVSVAVRRKDGHRLILLASTPDPPAPASALRWDIPVISLKADQVVDPADVASTEFPRVKMASSATVPLVTGSQWLGNLYVSTSHRDVHWEEHFGPACLLAALVVYSLTDLQTRRAMATPGSAALGTALRQVRHDLGLTQAEVAERMQRGRIALSRWEAGSQPPSGGPLYDWCRALGIVQPDKPTIVKLVDITPRLLRALREDPDRLRQLAPGQLEGLVAERLDRMGYSVTLTGAAHARDGGIDLIATRHVPGVGPLLIAGQVKHHRADRKTGRPAADRLLAWMGSDFHLGLLVTNTEFTRDARWLAEQERNRAFLRLRDFEDLKRWLEDNFWSEEDWIQIPDEVELAPGLRIKIPKVHLANHRDIWRAVEPRPGFMRGPE